MLTDIYTEDEIQALIVLDELTYPVINPNNNHYQTFPKNITEAQTYFRRFAIDLSGAFEKLQQKGLVRKDNDARFLTSSGKSIADEVRLLRPPIYYWYRDFYIAIENSRAFEEFSARVFGKNLGQHDFCDIEDIQKMLDLIKLDKSSLVLDIGCGNGKIAEYISDLTGASVMGIDYIQEAIAQALKRTAHKRDRLNFKFGNLEYLDFAPGSFNIVLSMDSIYFGRDISKTLFNLNRLLKSDGCMAIFYLNMGDGELPAALSGNYLYDAYNFSQKHHEHMLMKHRIASEMKEAFANESNTFIWKNLIEESIPSLETLNPTINVNPMTRFLYIIKKN